MPAGILSLIVSTLPSARRIEMAASPPSTAVANGTVSSDLRSAPRAGWAARCWLPAPRRNCLKRSAKPPDDSASPWPAAAEEVVEIKRIGLRASGIGPFWLTARPSIHDVVGGSELVESLTLLGIAEDFERGLHFLELVFGRGIIRIHVRMVFPRELAISLLDVLGGGIAFDTESGVWVFGHGRRGKMLRNIARKLPGTLHSTALRGPIEPRRSGQRVRAQC